MAPACSLPSSDPARPRRVWGGAQSCMRCPFPHGIVLTSVCSRCFPYSPALREGKGMARNVKLRDQGVPAPSFPDAGRHRRPLPTGARGAAAQSPPSPRALGLPKLPLRTSEACARSSRSVLWTWAAGPVTAGCWAARRLVRALVTAGPWAFPVAPTVCLLAASIAVLCWRRGWRLHL